MNIYTRKQRWKLALLFAAMVIGIASLWYTNTLVNKLAEQEKKSVRLWYSAVRQLRWGGSGLTKPNPTYPHGIDETVVCRVYLSPWTE